MDTSALGLVNVNHADGFVMSKSFKFAAVLLLFAAHPGINVNGAERPTLNTTCDPRPDILRHPIYYATTEYRREYNRPRYVSGWIASKIAPSSQEAMVFCENLQAGAYETKHAPPRYKRYFAPKPWEVLLTGARPDFPKSDAFTAAPSAQTQPRNLSADGDAMPQDEIRAADPIQADSTQAEVDEPSAIETGERVPAPLNDLSPSDR